MMPQRFTAEERQLYQEQIDRSNYRTLRFFAWVWLPLSVVNIFAQSIADATPLRYGFAFALLGYFIILSVVVGRHKPVSFRRSTYMIYAVQVVPLAISILLGTFLDPLHQAITIFGFITLMPVLILDRKRRVMGWLAFWSAAFLVCSFLCKAPEKFKGDVIHTVEFAIISAAVTLAVMDNRTDSIRNYISALHAVIDPLTGLQNMQRFLENAEHAWSKSAAQQAIAYFNTAGLKKYNAHFGYQAGSELLRHVAETLSAAFGEEHCSRFSDDHFMVMAESAVIREQISAVVSRAGALERSCPVYAGVYELQPGDEIELACDRAKMAVDAIKQRAGSPYYQYYDAAFQQREEHRHYIQYHLEEAIQKHWIKTYYQPIVRSSTNHICNIEALARWDDPELGLLSPAEFIPILEQSKKLYLLDLEVVRQAAAAIRAQEEAGMPESPVSVNLSRYDFESTDMVQAIIDIADRAGIPHRMLVIEITESALLNREELIRREIDRFHDAGFQVWMDDFGSGWSSLNLLTMFHFDQIKLDMQFALRIREHEHNKLVVKHVLELAQQLGIDTLAEGIETEEQYLLLKELGCDKLQGYYYSRPLPEAQAMEILCSRAGIPFEEEKEREYYKTVGTVSFADALASHQETTQEKYGVEMPMAIVEIDPAGAMYVLRANEPYISFVERYGLVHDSFARGEIPLIPEVNRAFAGVYQTAVATGSWTKVTETLVQGVSITSFARHLCHNPVTGRDALFFALIDFK